MGAVERQKDFRRRLREKGMVDIRLDIPKETREKIKDIAFAKKKTMKQVIQEQLEELVRVTTI